MSGALDLPAKVNGTARYGIDVVDVPGTVYAAPCCEAPAEGAKAMVANLDDVAKMKGIAAAIPLPFGVAVIGGSVEATRAGRNALKVTWDMAESPAKDFNSAKAMEEYAATAKDPKAQTRVAHKIGPTKEILVGSKIVEANYSSQYVYHAQMEPMNAVAVVAEDGKSAEISTGTQFAALISFIVSGILKTTPDKIVMHQKFLGGGYGRRLGPDIAIQAVILASIVKKPVKLILTREDDFSRGAHATDDLSRAEGGSRRQQQSDRLVSSAGFRECRRPRSSACVRGQRRRRYHPAGRGWSRRSYDILSILAEGVRKQNGVRVWPWRAIGTGYNKFAAEAFLDEVAQTMGRDPLALRLELTKNHPRATAVIKAVAEMSDFAKKRSDRGKGIAFCNYDGTYTACVAEASVDKQTGKISVHNLWMAIDPGRRCAPRSSPRSDRERPSVRVECRVVRGTVVQGRRASSHKLR